MEQSRTCFGELYELRWAAVCLRQSGCLPAVETVRITPRQQAAPVVPVVPVVSVTAPRAKLLLVLPAR